MKRKNLRREKIIERSKEQDRDEDNILSMLVFPILLIIGAITYMFWPVFY